MELTKLIDLHTDKSDPPGQTPWELDLLAIAKAKQHGDCLYLHCHPNAPVSVVTKIVEAIATDLTPDSTMLVERIRRVKLHGKMWALGVDLPVGDAATAAAEITEQLVQELGQKKRTANTVIKLILKQNCLNILCESLINIPQVEMALPILSTLRKTRPSEYLQAVSVSGRLKGGKLADWSFDIDLKTLRVDRSIDTKVKVSQAKTEVKPVEKPAENLVEDLVEQAIASNVNGIDPKTELLPSQPSALTSALSTTIVIDRFPQQAIPKITRPARQVSKYPTKSSQTKSKIPLAAPSLKSLYSWLLVKGETKASDRIAIYVLSLVVGMLAVWSVDRTIPKYVLTNSAAATPSLNTAIDPKHKRIVTHAVPNYKNVLLGQKLDLLNWHMSVFRQPPDVMIVGSSRALRGIDPTTLEASLAQRGYKGVQVFNMGVNGATAKVVNLQITRILASDQLPKMIIWADGVRAFNSSRNDLTFKDIASSPGYAQLNTEIENQLNANSSNKSTSGNGIGMHPSGNQISERPAEKILERILLTPLSTYNNREQLRVTLVDRYNNFSKILSNSEAIIAKSIPKGRMEMDAKGFLALSVTFDPQTYFQVHPFVSGASDSDYQNFDLGGEQMDAFNAFSNFCQQKNIRLVVVNMPLHAVYLDPIRSKYDTIFSTRMRELSTAWNFAYIDLGQALREQSDDFSDPSHLNYNGAITVAKELAANPAIPWQDLR
jgi:hypothetical protein